MLSGGGPHELGEDIIFFVPDGGAIPEALVSRYRFLDVLWLPCPLDQLRPEQIFTINRFRESRILAEDGQFKYKNQSRRALVALIENSSAKSLLEIGCGRFPLADDLPRVLYRGIDIDAEAISHCRSCGLDVSNIAESTGEKAKFDLVVSLYALHFAVDTALLSYVRDHISDQGCLIFNLIVDDGQTALTKLSRFAEFLPCLQIVREECMSKREFFFVMAKPAGCESARELARVLASWFRSGRPSI